MPRFARGNPFQQLTSLVEELPQIPSKLVEARSEVSLERNGILELATAGAYLFHGSTIFLAGFAFHFREVKSHGRMALMPFISLSACYRGTPMLPCCYKTPIA
jgi:hypothetical protein